MIVRPSPTPSSTATPLSRRGWLTLAGGSTLALLSRTARSANDANPTDFPLGFGTYGLPDYPLPDAIELIATTGFDSIEIAAMPGYHGDPNALPPNRRGEMRDLLADSGLRLGALMGLPEPDPARRDEKTARVEKLLQLALDLSPDGPPLIQSVLGGGEWEEKKSLFRDALGPWVELASQAGVELAIKPHRGHAMSRPEQGIWLIEQLDAAGNLSLVYDHSHYAHRDLPVAETVATALPHTGYLVMKDAVVLDGEVRFALPGATGSIPHADILEQFHEGGYRGEVCCEVSSQVWRRDDYDPAAAARTCFTNLGRIVDDIDESGFTPLFNGKDLAGWDGKPGAWEVRDGEIWCTGASEDKNWLIWREDRPGDFVLRLEFRWDEGNSGVQVRSDDLGDWRIFGYQVEVAQQDAMGLWHHSLLAKDHPKKPQRHLMAEAGESVVLAEDGSKSVTRIQDAEAVQSHYRERAWNEMEIIARGPTLEQKINGVTFAILTDRDAEMSRKKGFIALQDHGRGCRVAFRNLRIRRSRSSLAHLPCRARAAPSPR